MQTKIEHTLFFRHRPEAVWEYLTNAELITQWLMKNDFKPVVGHEFMFLTTPLPNYHFDGNIYCKVLEIIPLKKLAYSWRGGADKDNISLDSVVTWTLEEKEDGTQLHLEHTGFKGDENIGMYMVMNEGWFRIINKMNEMLNNAAK